jgi:hypothetical protein
MTAETKMIELLEPTVLTGESTSTSDRIECVDPCHNGPIDDSPKTLREAARHDPEAPAAFLLICPCCDVQRPLCAKKVDAILEWGLIGNGFGKCRDSGKRLRIDDLLFLPLNPS